MGGEEVGMQYQQAVRHRPHLEVDEKYFGGKLSWYREWISSPAPDAPLWHLDDNQRLLATPESLDIPILMIGGWYDVFFGAQYGDWERLATQPGSRFVIGPWTHVDIRVNPVNRLAPPVPTRVPRSAGPPTFRQRSRIDG